MTLKFTLARRLGNPNIDNKEKEKEDERMEEEHNLFNMPQQVENVEDKVIDVNQDLKLEDQNNQDNSENVQNENERNDNVGDVIENTNWENEQREEQELKDRMRNVSNVNTDGDKQEKSEEEIELEKKEWTLENCYPVYRYGEIYKWITTLSVQQINDMYLNKLTHYNYDAQRGYIENKKGVKKPKITKKHADNILNKLLQKKLHGGVLTLNYFKEYPTLIEYDEENHTLHGKGSLAIVDGGHRNFAALKQVKLFSKGKTDKNPELFYYPIIIENLSKPESMDLFKEYASGKPISKVRQESLNVFDDIHNMAEEIIVKSEINNRVERINPSPKGINFLTYSQITNGIRVFSPIATKKDASEIVEFLISFWDELVYLFKDQMGNIDIEQRKSLNQQNFVLSPMHVLGYFHIAKALQHDENWKEKLKKLTYDNFMMKDNEVWKPILREGNKLINTSGTQKITIDLMLKKVLE